MKKIAALVLSFLAALAVCANEENPGFRLFVSNERSGDVTVIDGKTFEVLETFPVGKRPRGIRLSSDGKTLYVATSGSPRLGPDVDAERENAPAEADRAADGVAFVDPQSGKVSKRFKVGSDPEQFTLSTDGRRLIVANEDAATATIWDIETERKITTAKVTADPGGVALHPTRDEVWVTCGAEGDVYALHPETGQQLRLFRLGGRPRTVAFSPDGAIAYVPLEAGGAVAILDAAGGKLLEKVPLPPPALPMGSVVSADGRELFVSTGRGNQVVVIETEGRQVVAAIDVGKRPWGVALSPDGKHLFTANGASDDVSVVDVATRKELRRIKTGAGPWGIAIGR